MTHSHDSPVGNRGTPGGGGEGGRGGGCRGGGDAAGLRPCPGGGHGLHGGLHVGVRRGVIVVGQLGGSPGAKVVPAEVVRPVVREDGDSREGVLLDVLQDLTHLRKREKNLPLAHHLEPTQICMICAYNERHMKS